MILTCGNIDVFNYFSKILTFNFNKSALSCYFEKVSVKFWNGRKSKLLFRNRRRAAIMS